MAAATSSQFSKISKSERSIRLEKPSDNEDKEQSFPLFDLPREIVHKILREYVPVVDKATALESVSEFRPYLALESLWFPSSLRLFRLQKILPAGWYVDARTLHERLHVSVDYDDLTFTVQMFSTRFVCEPVCVNTTDDTMSFANMRTTLIEFHSLHSLRQIDESDILYYTYPSRDLLHCVCFWIFVREKTVRWSGDIYQHPLTDNRCVIDTGVETLLLTLFEDRTLKITCLIHRREIHGHCSCPVHPDLLFSPLTFRACPDDPSTPSFRDRIRPQICWMCRDSPNVVHPSSVLVFKNFHRNDSSAVNRQYKISRKIYFFRERGISARRRLVF